MNLSLMIYLLSVADNISVVIGVLLFVGSAFLVVGGIVSGADADDSSYSKEQYNSFTKNYLKNLKSVLWLFSE